MEPKKVVAFPLQARRGAIDRFVGSRLAEMRMRAGFDLSELATQSKVSVKRAREWEVGVRRIPAPQLFQLARLLNVRVAAFFGRSRGLS